MGQLSSMTQNEDNEFLYSNKKVLGHDVGVWGVGSNTLSSKLIN